MLQCHYLRWAGLSTLATLQAVGMQIADSLAARVVGRELDRADAGALLALHLTGTRQVDVRERLGQWSLFGLSLVASEAVKSHK